MWLTSEGTAMLAGLDSVSEAVMPSMKRQRWFVLFVVTLTTVLVGTQDGFAYAIHPNDKITHTITPLHFATRSILERRLMQHRLSAQTAGRIQGSEGRAGR